HDARTNPRRSARAEHAHDRACRELVSLRPRRARLARTTTTLAAPALGALRASGGPHARGALRTRVARAAYDERRPVERGRRDLGAPARARVTGPSRARAGKDRARARMGDLVVTTREKKDTGYARRSLALAIKLADDGLWSQASAAAGRVLGTSPD